MYGNGDLSYSFVIAQVDDGNKTMKLNFWQILGAGLIVIGVIFVVRKQMAQAPAPPPTTVAPVPSSQVSP